MAAFVTAHEGPSKSAKQAATDQLLLMVRQTAELVAPYFMASGATSQLFGKDSMHEVALLLLLLHMQTTCSSTRCTGLTILCCLSWAPATAAPHPAGMGHPLSPSTNSCGQTRVDVSVLRRLFWACCRHVQRLC
jgi:hypothetical protein